MTFDLIIVDDRGEENRRERERVRERKGERDIYTCLKTVMTIEVICDIS